MPRKTRSVWMSSALQMENHRYHPKLDLLGLEAQLTRKLDIPLDVETLITKGQIAERQAMECHIKAYNITTHFPRMMPHEFPTYIERCEELQSEEREHWKERAEILERLKALGWGVFVTFNDQMLPIWEGFPLS